MNRMTVSFVPRRSDEPEQLVSHLKSFGTEQVSVEEPDDLALAAETVLIVIALGTVGLSIVTRVADWLRDRDDCLLIIDARGESVAIQERCDIAGRRGQVILVTTNDQQIVIEKNEAVLNLEALVKHAIDQSSATVIELAQAAGANAFIESPRSVL